MELTISRAAGRPGSGRVTKRGTARGKERKEMNALALKKKAIQFKRGLYLIL